MKTLVRGTHVFKRKTVQKNYLSDYFLNSPKDGIELEPFQIHSREDNGFFRALGLNSLINLFQWFPYL